MNSRELPLDDLIRLAGRDAARSIAADWQREDDSDLWFSPAFEAKMDALTHRSERRFRHLRVLRTVLVAAAILALLAATAMAVPTVREAIIRTWITWTGRSADFRYYGRGPTSIDLLFTEPQYLPDGYSETTRLETSDLCEIIYENASGVELIFSRTLANSTLLSVDSEHSTYSVIEMGGIQVHLFTTTSEDYPSHVVMYHGNTLIHIAGYTPTDQLVKILESLF